MTQRTPSWAYILGLVLFFVGIRVGINLADVDQKVSFLNHRSILTHGWVLPLLLSLHWLCHRAGARFSDR